MHFLDHRNCQFLNFFKVKDQKTKKFQKLKKIFALGFETLHFRKKIVPTEYFPPPPSIDCFDLFISALY